MSMNGRGKRRVHTTGSSSGSKWPLNFDEKEGRRTKVIRGIYRERGGVSEPFHEIGVHGNYGSRHT